MTGEVKDPKCQKLEVNAVDLDKYIGLARKHNNSPAARLFCGQLKEILELPEAPHCSVPAWPEEACKAHTPAPNPTPTAPLV